MGKSRIWTVGKPALLYLAFGFLWILISDYAVHFVPQGLGDTSLLETVKGLLFVILSAVLIYFLTVEAVGKQSAMGSRVRQLETDLRDLAEHTDDFFFIIDFEPELRFSYVSPSCLHISGYSQEDFYRDAELGYKIIHPDDAGQLSALLKVENVPTTLRWIHKEGHTYYTELRTRLRRTSDGEVTGISGIARDVTLREKSRDRLKQLSDTSQLLWRINRTMARRTNESEIFSDACSIPLVKADFALIWVGKPDADDRRLVPAFAAGEAREMLTGIRFTREAGVRGTDPTQSAWITGRAQYVDDYLTDKRDLIWRQQALAKGIRSAASFPLHVNGKVAAIWSLYAREPHYFKDDLRDLFKRLAEDFRYSLEVLEIRKQKETLTQVLEERERRLNAIFNASPMGVTLVDSRTGVLKDCNTAFASMLGQSIDQLRGKTWQSITPAEDVQRQQATVDNLDGSENPLVRLEKQYVRADGSTFWAKVTVARIPVSYPEGPANFAIIEDISEQRVQRERLARAQELTRAVLDSVPDSIAVIDAAGKIIAVNRAWKIFGAENGAYLDWVGQNYLKTAEAGTEDASQDVKKLREIVTGIRKVLTEELELYSCEYPCHGPDQLRWFTMSVVPLRGAQTGAVISHTNITTRVLAEDQLKKTISELEAAERVAHLGSWLWNIPAGTVRWSKQMYEIFGYNSATPEVSISEIMRECVHPDDRAHLAAEQEQLRSTGSRKTAREYRIIRPDGQIRYLNSIDGELEFSTDGKPAVLRGIVQDITEHAEAIRQMALDAAVISHTRDGVVVTDLTPRIISVNEAYTAITGYTAEELLGKNPALLKSGRQDARFYRAMWDEIAATGRWQGELYNRRKNGEIYPQLSTIDTIYDGDGKPQYYVGVFSDITKLKKSEEGFERLAHYDILTGLPNRLMVTSRLAHAIESAARHDRLIGVLFMDLDHFKNINDSLGHLAGDELLAAVAKRLQARIRSEDTIARLGGDEFLILLEDLENPEQAALVARDLLANLSAPFRLASDHEVYSGGSIGISLYPQDGDNAPDLIRNADAAMYLSKSEGRSTFRFYRNSLTAAARKRLELEAALRRALEQKELHVAYQPIVDMHTGQVCGAEALCRWRTADGQEIPPVDFIPVAEETGLIVTIGDFVLRTALAQVAQWLKHRHFKTIAINVSVRQFQKPDWFERFAAIIGQSGVAPEHIEIEITESDIMQRSEEGIEVIRKLHSSGVRIAIDDFGTGYSSLSYLQRFSVHKLKIDQSFVRELPQSHATMQLVRTMITLARNLGLSALAEGVETVEQMQFLKAEGCNYYQGYLMSKPVPAEEFEKKFLATPTARP